MQSRYKVVLTDYVWESLHIEHDLLDDVANLATFKNASPDEFLTEAKDCDALLNTYSGPITAEVIAELPQCKIIARYGIGVDTIDVEAATNAGIIVTNNPTYCVHEVAEHTLAMIFAGARKIPFYDRQTRAGNWSVPHGKPIYQMASRTIGLVGFGNIAQVVARKATALGMTVIFFDPFLEVAPAGITAKKCSFDELLREADIVSLHAPLTKATTRLIDAAAFKKMKSGAFLVNVARGPLIDTDALVVALDSGKIAGCALDTTDPEPLPRDHELLQMENVIITPHSAWYSEEAMKLLQIGAPSEVRKVLTGQWPKNVVNPAVRNRNRAGL